MLVKEADIVFGADPEAWDVTMAGSTTSRKSIFPRKNGDMSALAGSFVPLID